jgi:conjugal transfer pilus assembly protein TraF
MSQFKSICALFTATAMLCYAQSLCAQSTLSTQTATMGPKAQDKPTPALTNWFDASIWDNPDRDFRWYPPDPMPLTATPPAPNKPVPAPAPLKNRKISEFKKFDEIQKHMAALREVAVLTPTTENVKEYYKFQMQLLDQSSTFADVSRRVIWQNPEIDYSNRNPYNNTAALTYVQEHIKTVRKTSTDLAKTHGLFFFFRSDCPYCHTMAPTIAAFARRSGMQIVAVSTNGGSIRGLSNVVPDNGLSTQLEVTTVPALFLVEKKTKAITPLGTGVLAMEDITERIHVLTNTEPGKEF